MSDIERIPGQPFYTDAETLQERIDDYFNTCNEEGRPLTVPGLALHLGFASRQSLWEYSKKDMYHLPIKQALLKIEQFTAEQLYNPKVKASGPIFTLKNMGWVDKQEIEHSGEGLNIVIKKASEAD